MCSYSISLVFLLRIFVNSLKNSLYRRMEAMVVEFIFLLFYCFIHLAGGTSFTGSLSADPSIIDGVLTACMGSSISITCTHNNTASAVTRWEVTGFLNSSMDCDEVISVGESSQCSPFNLLLSTGPSGSTFISTAQTKATEILNGTVVTCFNSGLDNIVGNVTISVLGIPTPSLKSVEQVSQSVVRVSLSVADSRSQCVGSYLVEATPVGGSGSTNTSSLTPTVDVNGLDVCQYNYSFVGSILSPDGIQSEPTLSESFSADLTGARVNTIVTIRREDPQVEWMTDFPLETCISHYVIADQNNPTQTLTVNSTTRSLTAQQLNNAGFPYCTTINVTVTPITPMGPLETVHGDQNLVLQDPMLADLSLHIPYRYMFVGLTLRVSIQEPVPENYNLTYQYTVGGKTSPIMMFTGDSLEINFSEGDRGKEETVMVVFQRNDCERNVTFTIAVPNTTDVTPDQPSSTTPSSGTNHVFAIATVIASSIIAIIVLQVLQ